MKDYFTCHTALLDFQNTIETQPSLPSKGAFDGNDGCADNKLKKTQVPKMEKQRICENCSNKMDQVEKGYHSCPFCHAQIVEPHSGYWTFQV